jgi:uncharacterized membrane protein YraQ (UPF0718 family)/copper chaperone CopZ
VTQTNEVSLVAVYLFELWSIMLELAPPLLVGLLLAGFAHIWLPKAWVQRQLSRPTFGSVLRSVVLGVPLPLCSCGVVPTAIALRNQGASKGAATSFLISTPQTGVDSILVSAAFLGWPFALFKVAAAAVTGVLGGLVVNRLDRSSAGAGTEVEVAEEPTSHSILEAARYAVFDLLAMIDRWLVAGVLLAALIAVVVPTGFFAEQSWTRGILGMLLVLAVALPLYICTTSSVPIAASLIAAGMPLGSALVFLMAGPATNIATLGAVYRGLGGRVLAIYLSTVVVMSLALGLTFDFVLAGAAAPTAAHEHGAAWWSVVSAVLLLVLLAVLTAQRLLRRLRASPATGGDMDTLLKVEGMTCQHCVGNVKRALEAVEGVEEATPDINAGQVAIKGEQLDANQLAAAVERAGYKAIPLSG